MDENLKQALLKFSEVVSVAIAAQANGKDVLWGDVIDAQEELAEALKDS